MIYTSSYRNINIKDFKDKTLSISGDRGVTVNYEGNCYMALAPKRSFWNVWHDNRSIVPKEENDKYYIREFYDKVLSKLNPQEEYDKLDEHILLCYENENEFCHRQIVAAWFELMLGVVVPEVKQNGYSLVTVTNRENIKNYLEEVIKSKTDMRGLNSLNALYLYNKAEALENNIRSNEDIYFVSLLKSYSYQAEEEYLKSHKNKCMKVEI